MKVFELFENDEWTSNAVTLQYLYKRQLAATHAFMVEVLTLLRKHPNDPNLSALSRWKSLHNKPSGVLGIDLNVEGLGFPSLEQKLDRMINAKYDYERAGGKFNTSGAWEVPT